MGLQPTTKNRHAIMREMRTRGRRYYYRAQLQDIATRAAICIACASLLAAAFLLGTN